MKDCHTIIRRPIVTEKSHRLMENASRRRKGKVPTRLYTFEAHPKANKIDIRKAVEELFKVKVVKVRTLPVPRKRRRVGTHQGHTRRWKKTVVRLAPGQTIEIY